MKQRNILLATLLLTLVTIACNASVSTTDAVQATATAVTPLPAGGFTTGTPVDVTTLPILANAPGGGEPMPCVSESSEPSITWGYGIFPKQALCLNNFPTAPESPGFTIILTDPTGRTFQESFTYNQDRILNSAGAEVGYVNQEGSSIDGNPVTPGVSVQVYLPANLSCGNWSAAASMQDGSINIGATPLTLECQSPRLSVLSDLNTNPFISPVYNWQGPSFAFGETIYVVGSAYPPNSNITVAFYQMDPSAGSSETGAMLHTAKYAVSVMTDSLGNFQTSFVVDSWTRGGGYYVVAAPAITPDIKLHMSSPQFSIEVPTVSAASCAAANGSAPSIADPRPAPPIEVVGQIDRSLGGGIVQSKEFTIELLLYCNSMYGPFSMEPYYLSDISGLAIYYKWRYDGAPQNGSTYIFRGISPDFHGYVAEENSLSQGQMNLPGTNAMGVQFAGGLLPDLSQKAPVRFIYILQAPSGQLSGATLSFELQRVPDGIQPSNVLITALSDSELESLKGSLPPVTP
jgi:hypothetical protein